MNGSNSSELASGSSSILTDLYRIMVIIRKAEEKIVKLYPKQEMRCPVHLCIGQEAIAAGVCKNLNKEDIVFSNHRSHGHYLAKGGNLKILFAEIYGKADGCSKGRGGSMHLIDLPVNFLASTAIVSGTIPLAAGTAFASKLKNKNNISVAFFGDSAVEEGTFSETLNFSSLHKLPVLFVCENNLYASQTHIRERQPDHEICYLAKGHGIKTYKVDGNDVIQVYKVAKEAIAYLRAGKGPVFIETPTYRWKEHCGPYDDTKLGYRTEKEVLEWKERDPIKILKSRMLAENTSTEEQLKRIDQEIIDKVNEALLFAKKSPFPKEDTLAEFIYSK